MNSNKLHLVVALLAGLCLRSGTAWGQTGTIAGSVVLPPSQTKERSFRGSLYRNRLAPNRRGQEKVATPRSRYDDVIIGAHALDFDPPLQAAPAPARMDQKMARFWPRVLPITVGATVEFVNQDRFYHNVFSLSRPNDFDIGRKPTGVVAGQAFNDTGRVEVFCDIHPQMNATVLVLGTPWFTRPDSTGSFRLEALPEGRYRLHAYHPEHDDLERQIEVGGGVPMTQTFVFGR
ncbi:MAG TPA: carboxypeptidase regulatory-like domain-containing protein [Candidatus Latescibacteria bacterium]|jgi:plastocyanin|nr:hypothetical protein [Gemmatimonadaceae bacterium]MDP6014653.1 carboxypeptidase regulatory-like domain-containing protein [Candidatus Latescibacterota bacterium]HJP29256.1 carboxypeptidase regulatory-like domain-containing protein [Candidatus Latescibacterota bacterium]